jgi:hypothetical protein
VRYLWQKVWIKKYVFKDGIMKKIFGVAVVALVFTACGDGETGQREHAMQDNAVEAPTTSPQTNTTAYDSSTGMDVRDTSTTVAHDTSVVPKN